jgi:transcriptional regulator GlxA family with amidase domain
MTQIPRDCHLPDSLGPEVASRPQLSVGLVLLDQFTLAAFSGLIDVLRLSADLGGGSRQIHTAWRVMSVDGLPRTSSAGITLEVSGGLAQDVEAFDYIAICGGND